MNPSWEKILIRSEDTIRHSLEILNTEALQVALVVDDERRLLGIVTDGDIRRGLLRKLTLEASVYEVMNTNPISVGAEFTKLALIDLMEKHAILAIPVVKDGIVVGLETLKDALIKPSHDNPIFLMAGGFGTRLRPLTENCPKPMLRVGGRPMLEIVLLSFIRAGFKNFYISVHFKPDKIRDYFGDGSRWKVNISYVCEDAPLGTGGALGLLPKDMPNLPIIMMNADVLTKVHFESLLSFHNKNLAGATMCVTEYDHQIPYGVITGKGNKIVNMVEKPIQRFFVNAGIYVVSQEIARSVPMNRVVDMPTLLKEEMKHSQNILMFPIHEYWLDIGRMDDFNRAQADVFSMDV
ncbi:MAG: dTDP-glucose pyrophosphorylase [Desulforhopalus sp.]|jgi:dTDP-glucose pyrophosphorylase